MTVDSSEGTIVVARALAVNERAWATGLAESRRDGYHCGIMKSTDQEWYWSRVCRSRMGDYTSSFERRLLKRLLPTSEISLRVLDVGGGEGRYSGYVRQLGHSPVLLEYDSLPLEIFSEQDRGFGAIQADGLALPIRDSAFDVVMTIEVSICTTALNDNNTRHFRDVHRILRPNGLFLIMAFNRNSYIRYLKKLSKDRPKYEDAYYMEGPAEFARKLKAAGFEMVGCWGYRWLPFTRESNSPLIPVLAWLERGLLLSRLTRFSPWLFFAARKL